MKKTLTMGLFVLGLIAHVGCSKDGDCTEKTFHADMDRDGFGDPSKSQSACEKPEGYVLDNTDPDDNNKNIFPDCEQVTYFADEDGDGFGDPQNSQTLCSGQTKPEGYVTDNTDCNDVDPNQNPNIMVTYYADTDGDDFGNPNESQTISICDIIPEGYVLDNTDCDDTDDQIHPNTEDIPNDGIDQNCDGKDRVIWTGPDKVFTKNAQDDWTDPQFQDEITEKVVFTRQDNDYFYNRQWWLDNFGQDALHVPNTGSDVAWEFWGPPTLSIKNMGNIISTGGPQGIRFALLDSGDSPNTQWSQFSLYGTLGDETHFYSLHNIASIAFHLDNGIWFQSIINIHNIQVWNGLISDVTPDASMEALVGQKLGVWLMEEDIFFTLTFTEWTPTSEGGTISYTRSTPEF
ncbi:MopE-related protein [Flagellimonas nanhaiensis]|uniref:Uncharacterized protein n=1 Tax=Flagellimonas nanhaiensis TaxID=2292706 RepID=A0A371JUD6_9FLAO|nr:MopE-related protein [Allomuricauda nanhaiensis]RDY61433.1 hypothetical protein DX873_04535 [Allomuricauda nanhaiensis]